MLRAVLPSFAAISTAPALADQPLWELGAGLAGVTLPHYRGSAQSHRWLLPVPYAVYRGPVLRADRDGARAVLVDTPALDIDISVAATPPVRSSDDRARAGMPDLKATLEAGPNVNWRLWRSGETKLELRLPLRAVTTVQSSPRDAGFTFSPVLNLDHRVHGWNLGLQGGPVAGSRRYHDYWYGVAPAYATAARPAYAAEGGYGGWRLTAAVSRKLGPWWLGGFVRGDQVRGAVFDGSPLVQRRSNASAGFAVSYVFKVSDERVADPR